MSRPPGETPGTSTREADRARVVDADAIAAAVLACPAVVALSGGRVGEVASYLPGRRVVGVRVLTDAVGVHVIARHGPTCEQIAAQVRQAVTAVTGPLPVHVGIDDLVLDPTPTTPTLA